MAIQSYKKIRKPNTPFLNLHWEKFCRLYVSNEFIGNGTWCYINAFYLDISKKGVYNTARSRAARLLTNVHIKTRIKELLDTAGFNETNIQKQHAFLINQCVDLKVKARAIELFYRINGKLSNKKIYLFTIADVLNYK